MYLLKIKGGGKIPDYMQIRDDNFTLIAYFKADNLASGLTKVNLKDYIHDIESIISDMPFGKMKYIKNK